jgi:acyl carrier protein
VPGQLYIGGDGVARGYRNRPELTAERFIDDAFRPGERIYATGDLVRCRPGGSIEFLGRLDHQVKLRGFRVELGEVEDVLTRHPAVRSGVAVVREDTPGDRRLVAYYVQEPRTATGAGELRRHLGAQLPVYMVPSTFVCLDELPISANRKVDRSALPPPESTRPEVERPYVRPRTPIEEMVVDTWLEVLGLTRIGVEDDFFELGGNSLLATQVVARLARRLGISVPLRALFERPTPSELATTLVGSLAMAALDGEDGLRLVEELEQLDTVKGAK